MKNPEGFDSVRPDSYFELDTPELFMSRVSEEAHGVVTPDFVEYTLRTRGARPSSCENKLRNLGEAYGYDRDTSHMATECLVKQREARILESILDELDTPEQIDRVFQVLGLWLPKSFHELNSDGLKSYSVAKKPLALSILRGAGRVVTQYPDSLESVSTGLSELLTSSDDYTTAHVHKDLMGYGVAGSLSSRKSAEHLVGSNSIGAVAVLSKLTDFDLIPSDFWYAEGIIRLSDDPNFPFIEEVHRRLQENQDFPTKRRQTQAYYSDSARFLFNVLEGASRDESRHQENARRLVELLENGIQNSQELLPINNVIRLANVISQSINAQNALAPTESGTTKTELSKLDPQDFTEIGQAFSRLLSVTRLAQNDEIVNELQTYEDRIYAEILDQLMIRAINKHAEVPETSTDLRMRYPDASEVELAELSQLLNSGIDPDMVNKNYQHAKRAAIRPKRVSWEIKKPGYGALS